MKQQWSLQVSLVVLKLFCGNREMLSSDFAALDEVK